MGARLEKNEERTDVEKMLNGLWTRIACCSVPVLFSSNRPMSVCVSGVIFHSGECKKRKETVCGEDWRHEDQRELLLHVHVAAHLPVWPSHTCIRTHCTTTRVKRGVSVRC